MPLGFEVINLGGDRLTSMNSLIGQIAQIVGRQPIIERRPAHPADMPATLGQCTKSQAPAGLDATISLKKACAARWLGIGKIAS